MATAKCATCFGNGNVMWCKYPMPCPGCNGTGQVHLKEIEVTETPDEKPVKVSKEYRDYIEKLREKVKDKLTIGKLIRESKQPRIDIEVKHGTDCPDTD